jgi:hypothetical protein
VNLFLRMGRVRACARPSFWSSGSAICVTDADRVSARCQTATTHPNVGSIEESNTPFKRYNVSAGVAFLG